MIRQTFLVLSFAAFASLLALPAQAIFFSDRVSFNAAAPGLPTEDFENTFVGFGALAAPCSNSISAASNDTCFGPGGILPGITLSSVQNTSGMVVINGTLGQSSATVGPNAFADDLSVEFGPGVNAAFFDVFTALDTDGGTFGVSVFGSEGLIASMNVTTTGIGTSASFGVIQNQPILQLLFQNVSGDSAELIDNITFGTAAVPEPASAALLALGLTGFAVVRRRKTKVRAKA